MPALPPNSSASQASSLQDQGRPHPESMVDGKSIMAVMMLAAGKGTEVHLHTEGEFEQEALDGLVELINNRFDEGE